MKTINILNISTETVGDLSTLTDVPDVDFINERIIGSLMIAIQSDLHALAFCDIMENLVDNKSSATYVETFRNGN